MVSAMDAADQSHAEATELLTDDQRSGEASEFQCVKGPNSNTRKINSKPARMAGEVLRARSRLLAGVDGSRDLPRGGSESEGAPAVV